MTFVLMFLLLVQGALAQQPPPDRQIPPTVLTEVKLLETRFEVALADDCDPERCFPKGCIYGSHTTADRPPSKSLPGLAADPGPGSSPAQEYLTAATCSFAYEDSVQSRDVGALSRRLESKLSRGWLIVSVSAEKLQPLPPYLKEAPVDEPEEEPEEEEEVEPEPVEEPEPEPWTLADALRELWNSLLPHFYWMVGVVLFTMASMVLIWAYRRVGARSIEEEMMLAEIAAGGGEPDADEATEGAPEVADEGASIARKATAWRMRLEAMDPSDPDPEIRALTRDLLRNGELDLLAKALMHFPNTLPAAFPAAGELATAKLELSEYLKDLDESTLPSDAEFFAALERHALSATLASQADAELVRSLRDEFGASGLASIIAALPPRPGALLFAMAPAVVQHELVQLIVPQRVAEMADMLLRSNRMGPEETAYLFEVVAASRTGGPLPPPPAGGVSDRGAPFDAVGALTVLLESMHPARRDALFGDALARLNGSLPTWYRDLLVGDMLFELGDEARADLMLDVEVEALAAWLSLLDGETRQRLMQGVPSALANSVRAVGVPGDRERLLELARLGRAALARGFQLQLLRAGKSFAAVLHPVEGATP